MTEEKEQKQKPEQSARTSSEQGEKKEQASAESAKPKKIKKKRTAVDAHGKAFIKASFNNIIITLTDMQGRVITWASAGRMGFKGSKKNTPYAAQVATDDCVRRARDMGLRKVEVYVKGPGSGRDSAIRTLQVAGLEITLLKDMTPLPHNGCRPPGRRRV